MVGNCSPTCFQADFKGPPKYRFISEAIVRWQKAFNCNHSVKLLPIILLPFQTSLGTHQTRTPSLGESSFSFCLAAFRGLHFCSRYRTNDAVWPAAAGVRGQGGFCLELWTFGRRWNWYRLWFCSMPWHTGMALARRRTPPKSRKYRLGGRRGSSSRVQSGRCSVRGHYRQCIAWNEGWIKKKQKKIEKNSKMDRKKRKFIPLKCSAQS